MNDLQPSKSFIAVIFWRSDPFSASRAPPPAAASAPACFPLMMPAYASIASALFILHRAHQFCRSLFSTISLSSDYMKNKTFGHPSGCSWCYPPIQAGAQERE